MAPSKNKKAKAAAAANKKEEKKPPSADAPPSEAFHAAMAEYYAQRDWFNEYKTQFWASIPESPPNESPKIPLEKPWWDKEHEAKWEKHFPGLLESRRQKDGAVDEEGLTNAFQSQMKLQGEKEEEEKAEKKRIREERQKEKEAAAASGKGKKKEVKGEEFADDDFEIVDVDGLIRRLTGQWELNVPQAFKFPK